MAHGKDERTLGEIITTEDPYPDCLDGVETIERYGIGAAFDQAFPFQWSRLDPADPRYWQGVFVTLARQADPPRTSEATTETHRAGKAIRIIDRQGRAIIVLYEGGGGGM